MNAEASADARLHEAIALASHNVMFLHLQTSMISMLREHITVYGLGLRQQNDAVSAQLFLQHKNVCDMICAGRSEEAPPCKPTSTTPAAACWNRKITAAEPLALSCKTG
jgi:DNA-binding FadR family transcriptional regulator